MAEKMTDIAALYVQSGGVYYGIDGVDPWDEQRDARKYSGPDPVVAHPPCARWGNYWHGSPSSSRRYALGDDNGCFAAAIEAVRTYGGVLEHPEASHAWLKFGLQKPPKCGAWVASGDWTGWTCCVEQGHYGHRARKATWLYVVGARMLPSLRWGQVESDCKVEDMSKAERARTPLPFRDLLLSIARSCRRPDG